MRSTSWASGVLAWSGSPSEARSVWKGTSAIRARITAGVTSAKIAVSAGSSSAWRMCERQAFAVSVPGTFESAGGG